MAWGVKWAQQVCVLVGSGLWCVWLAQGEGVWRRICSDVIFAENAAWWKPLGMLSISLPLGALWNLGRAECCRNDSIIIVGILFGSNFLKDACSLDEYLYENLKNVSTIITRLCHMSYLSEYTVCRGRMFQCFQKFCDRSFFLFTLTIARVTIQRQIVKSCNGCQFCCSFMLQ